jgi:tRNA(Ile)-lysidine synthase
MADSRKPPPADLSACVLGALRAHLPEPATLWVGLSGGRDSIVLLHLCWHLLPSGRLRAVHVHHGLSPHADAWADFCKRCCQNWDIPLEILPVNVSLSSGLGLEAAARKARYQAYRECAQRHGARYLALAHHRRDQAETLLFNLCRGAGIAGAAAMPRIRKTKELSILRPLLECDADAIFAYAAHHGLEWVEDESNQDERHDRNFLRHQIFPHLKARFPALESTLSRAAGYFSEAQELLRDLAANDDHQIDGRLDLMRPLSMARQANWLRYRMSLLGEPPPPSAALDEALRQLAKITADGQFEWRFAKGSLRVWQGRFYHVPYLAGPPPMSCFWNIQEPCAWAGGILYMENVAGQGLNPARLQGQQLEIRPRLGGERISPGPGRPRRPLKKLLQERNCPPWKRERLPLLYLNDELLACPGVAIAAAWQCGADENGLVPVWRQDDEKADTAD